ncbi:hypothetical protein HB779_17425 [Phyllobacterium sp. 628]|uniref:hypothetical protein n=1 Tax=Phyllobacterium sp. 628 TaxID=2718938 RepID=UPI00166230D4|nr:hypothetical protein [Phyllobacterium sp. 628]QND53469.1 hypothetical protein HB779_17425 [Phyllobacterium sp. 628]
MTDQDKETAYYIQREVHQTKEHNQRLEFAVAQNIATNGRLFCVMLFIVCLIAKLGVFAVIAALPVGLSCIADALPAGKLKSLFSLLIYALAAFVAIILLINLR